MAEREEDSKFVLAGVGPVMRKLIQCLAVSDTQAQEEEQLENKIINEGQYSAVGYLPCPS